MPKGDGKLRKLKLSYNLYYIGRCPLRNWENKFLQELSLECYHQIIQSLPYMALVKRGSKLKITKHAVCFKNEKISMQDIGYCKQYGCSVMFMVKHQSVNYEAICLLCSGLLHANSIFEALSDGYKRAKHPTFEPSDPWENTTEGDFFDDSLQDTTFYSNIKMYSSMADLEAVSDKDPLEEFNITPYKNICFSMEDIFVTEKRKAPLRVKSKDKCSENRSQENSNECDKLKENRSLQGRSVPTNVVKPFIRQSYHEMITLSPTPLKAVSKTVSKKKFGYRVSKI